MYKQWPGMPMLGSVYVCQTNLKVHAKPEKKLKPS